MQQTPLDRWLRRKFVYVTEIYCNVLPEGLPRRLKMEEAAPESGGRYRYKMTVKSEKVLKKIADLFELHNITYTSRVACGEGVLQRMLNRPNKSASYEIIWSLIIGCAIAFAFSPIPKTIFVFLTDEGEEEVAEDTRRSAADDKEVYRFEQGEGLKRKK